MSVPGYDVAVTDLYDHGVAFADIRLTADQCDHLTLSIPSVPAGRGGVRGLVGHPSVLQLLHHKRLGEYLWSIVGRDLVAIRATLFDRTIESSWRAMASGSCHQRAGTDGGSRIQPLEREIGGASRGAADLCSRADARRSRLPRRIWSGEWSIEGHSRQSRVGKGRGKGPSMSGGSSNIGRSTRAEGRASAHASKLRPACPHGG